MSSLNIPALLVELGSIPLPVAGRFVDESTIQVTYSVADYARSTRRATSRTIWLDGPRFRRAPTQDISDVVLSALSPSGEMEAVLRETADRKRVVEVWRAGQLDVSHDVTEAHDGFYSDAAYGTLHFSPSETAVIYVAEAKPPQNADPAYKKFEYTPPLGEGYPGRKRPTVFILRWAAPQASVGEHWESPVLASLDLISASKGVPTRFGQVLFSPYDKEERQLYATGYDLAPDGRLLGIVYCANRPSGIWHLTIPSVERKDEAAEAKPVRLAVDSATRLTPANLACRSPRIDHASGDLYFIACPVGGPHASTTTIWRFPITSSTIEKAAPQLVLDVVQDPYADSALDDLDAPFPGFYPGSVLPKSPFVTISDKLYIVSVTTWRSRDTVVMISANKVRDLCPGDEVVSWAVLDVRGNKILAVRSSLSIPYELAVGNLDEAGKVTWSVVEKPALKPAVRDVLSRMTTSVLQVPGHKTLEGLVLSLSGGSTNGTPPPTILEPHGGPHMAAVPEFFLRTAVFVAAGCSLGFGEAAVRALPGNCGRLDVEDSLAVLRELIRQGKASDDPRKLFYTGGSHGGFIGGHIVGQYPDLFGACVLRNPVISVGEVSTSDMPDWFFNEFGIEYPVIDSDGAKRKQGQALLFLSHQNLTLASAAPLMTPENYARLHSASPIAHVERVRTPVLLQVGDSDLRIAPTNGLGYYHALRAYAYKEDGLEDTEKSSRTNLLVFPGMNHGLDGLEESKAVILSTLAWLGKWGDRP
ncbi:alpha/beta-hydrolase [Schizophyllum commune H4-8]|uniref:alpha/beta-hydrolase n=1 Tax=Schizophyllum commune (strain H4-8 / FGSC 9210) TaxID=578458 RepID=UPI00215E8176|nr:alpha/beta-hydrolase [Schizophyllum commune H4-8]KAI5886787.1 alpha/beta-hydrolase [Schizophyllum commune H4-8]